MRLFPDEEQPGFAIDASSIIGISSNYESTEQEASGPC